VSLLVAPRIRKIARRSRDRWRLSFHRGTPDGPLYSTPPHEPPSKRGLSAPPSPRTCCSGLAEPPHQNV